MVVVETFLLVAATASDAFDQSVAFSAYWETRPFRIEIEPSTLPPAPRLSDRELEILQLVSEGHTNSEVAERLYLSAHTVKRHMANILAKLHLRTRVEAVL